MMSTIHNRQYQQYYMVMPAQQDCSDFAKGTLGYGGCNRVFCKYRHVDYSRQKKFCFQYESRRYCSRGATCTFRHCKARLLTCGYFLAGTCENGNTCMYSHGGRSHPKAGNTVALIENAEPDSEARVLTSGDFEIPMPTSKEAAAGEGDTEEILAEERAKVVAYQQARKASSPLAPAPRTEAELRAKVLASMTPKAIPATIPKAEAANIISPEPKAEPVGVAAAAELPSRASPPAAAPPKAPEDLLPVTTSSSKKRCREEDSNSDGAAKKKAKSLEEWVYTLAEIPKINYCSDEDQADFETSDFEA